MVNKKMSEGVGKKIVEALKKQSGLDEMPTYDENEPNELDSLTQDFSQTFNNENTDSQEKELLEHLSSEDSSSFSEKEEVPIILKQQPTKTKSQPYVNYQQAAPSANDTLMQELDKFEIPSNIAVLKKLIGQLPSGVTRHTGAQIIKQTMEALGISMKSVLQEAQQVQEGLNNSAKECYSTIQEYKKQIIMLDKQAQNYQKQYSALNELISLFIQTGV